MITKTKLQVRDGSDRNHCMDAFSEYITLSEVNESDTHGDRTQDRMFVVYNKIGHSSRSSSIQRSKTTEVVSGNVKQF